MGKCLEFWQFNPLVVNDKRHSLNNALLNSFHIRATTLQSKQKFFPAYQFRFKHLKLRQGEVEGKFASRATDFFPVTWDYSLSQHLRILRENVRGAGETFNAQSNKFLGDLHSPPLSLLPKEMIMNVFDAFVSVNDFVFHSRGFGRVTKVKWSSNNEISASSKYFYVSWKQKLSRNQFLWFSLNLCFELSAMLWNDIALTIVRTQF